MYWLFKPKKETEQEKQLAQQKIIALKAELKIIEDKVSAICQKTWEAERKRVNDNNSICPKCKGTNVNDRIKRQQGYLSGSMSGSSWSALTFGESSMRGSISGKMDTNEVNKCNSCNHEWKKGEASFTGTSGTLRYKIHNIKYLLAKFYDAEHCEFDIMDLDEKYNSIEEKKAALMKEANESFAMDSIKDFWSGTSISAINTLAKKHGEHDWDKYYNEEKLLSWGFKK